MVMKIDQMKRGIRSKEISGERMLMMVDMKLIAPRIDETPARWSEKIAKSTEVPEWASHADRGG